MTTVQLDEVYVRPLSVLARRLLIGLGFVFVGIGLVGTVIPGLPTTIFMILAAFCFGRASERWYRWLMTRRFVGPHFHNLMQGRGLPMRVKLFSIMACWVMLTFVAVVFVKSDIGRLGLLLAAMIQATSVLRIPTLQE